MKIAVAGATGRVGRHVVELLKSGGHDVVEMSRASGVDVISKQGLAHALKGVETIIDAASGPSPDQAASTEFFTTEASNLQEAGAHSGVKRIVVVSIIGIDRFTAGYMAAKAAHEKAHLAGSLPVRILRAAQFHEFVGQMMQWTTQGDVSYVPKMLTQLVSARSVAEQLIELALDPAPSSALGLVETQIPEVAGPKPENLADAAKLLVAHRGDPVRVEGVDNTTDPDWALYESGALLPGPHAILTGPTFEEWLATQ